jgi:hypothetical protein
VTARSGLEDSQSLSFGDHIIETYKDRFDLPRCRRGDRDFHFHGLDKGNIVTFADVCAGLNGKGADAAGDLRDNLDLCHSAPHDGRRVTLGRPCRQL